MALPEGASKAIRESVGLVEGSDWTESRSLAGGEGGGGRKGGEKEEEVRRGRVEDAGLDVGEVRGEVGVGVAGGGRGALPSAVARSVAARSLSSTFVISKTSRKYLLR